MSEPTSPPAGRAFTTALGAIAAVLAVLVVLLAVQNLRLKDELAATARSGGADPPVFAAGDPFGPVSVLDGDGESLTILDGSTGRPTLLLVFTSTCPACRETFPTWREVAARAVATGTDVVGVRLDAAAGEDPSSALPPDVVFPVYAPDPASPGPLFRVRSVPTTMLLDVDGAVRRVWSGTLDRVATRQIERALDDVAARLEPVPMPPRAADYGAGRESRGVAEGSAGSTAAAS